jgi:hypothetical protein
MLVPQRQQSASISHSRTDIGAPHSGQAHAKTLPLSQTSGTGLILVLESRLAVAIRSYSRAIDSPATIG